MIKTSTSNFLILALILTYSFAVMCWGLIINPVTPDEARTIYIGRGTMAREPLQCQYLKSPDSSHSIREIMCEYPGSSAIVPFATATADRFAGIYGARFISVILGLSLIILIYLTGNTLLHGKKGILAAATFVFLGIPLQLSSSANATVYSAFFLGASLLFIESAVEARTLRAKRLMLLVSAFSFSLVVMTNYIAVLFALPLVLFVFLRHRFLAACAFFLLPFLAAVSLYYYVAVLTALPSLEKSVIFALARAKAMSSLSFSYILNWLAMPYLLATFGIFHKERGENAFFMILLASPAFIVRFVSSDVSATHSAVLLSLVFLAPAGALGIAQMGNLFSSNISANFVKPLFITSVLVVIWVFGLQQIKALNHTYPNLSPAAAFLRQMASKDMTVLVESDYGSPEYVYRYYLDSANLAIQVVPIVRGDKKEREEAVTRMKPDYVVIDDLHSYRSFDQASFEYQTLGFTVAKAYQMSLSSGIKNVKIFQRGSL